MSKQQSNNQVFEKEDQILVYSKSVIEKTPEEVSAEQMRSEYGTLTDNYGKLLDEVKLLTAVSDRLQRKLNKANENVIKKNAEVKESSERLHKARADRRAIFIATMLGLAFVILSEALIEPHIEKLFEARPTLILMGIKIGIALLMYPIKKIIEMTFVKTEDTT